MAAQPISMPNATPVKIKALIDMALGCKDCALYNSFFGADVVIVDGMVPTPRFFCEISSLEIFRAVPLYKEWYYGPRGDRLHTIADVAPALLECAQQLEGKPIYSEDVPADAPEYEMRRVKRRPGGPSLANFENLPVATHVHALLAVGASGPEAVRAVGAWGR